MGINKQTAYKPVLQSDIAQGTLARSKVQETRGQEEDRWMTNIKNRGL